MTNDLVSICIPTRNGEKYLEEALDSIKNQSYRNIEVIISDDESSDNTILICERFKNEVEFPVYIHHHKASGIGANWNHCIGFTNGEYVKFLFQDDVLLTDTISVQLIAIKKNNAKAVFSKRIIVNKYSQEVLEGDWFKEYGDLQRSLKISDDVEEIFFTKKILESLPDLTFNIFGEPDTFLFHKSIFDEIGMFNVSFKQILDLEFSYRILKKYNILFLNKSLLKFRLHDEQASVANSVNSLEEYDLLRRYVKYSFFIYLSRDVQLNSIFTKVKRFFS